MSVPTQNFGGCGCAECPDSTDPCSACCGKAFALEGTVSGETVTWNAVAGEWRSDWIAFSTTTVTGTTGADGALTCTKDTGGTGYFRYSVSCAGSAIVVVATVIVAPCAGCSEYYPVAYPGLISEMPAGIYNGTCSGFKFDAYTWEGGGDPSSCDPLTVSDTLTGTHPLYMGTDPPLSATVSIAQVGTTGECIVDCAPCDIPAKNMTLTTVTSSGSNPTSTMTWTTGPDIWTSGCLSLGTTRTRCTLECDTGNTKFSAKVSSSTSVCDTTPTTYSITHGSTSTEFVVGEWVSVATQNWDGVTAPSITITGWNINTGIVTSTTNDVSSPNSLALETGATSTTWYATMTSTDGYSGNVRSSSRFKLTEAGRDSAFSLTLRSATSTPSTASGTYYACEVKDVDFSSSGWTVILYKRVSGTRTDLATTTSTEVIDSVDCKLVFSVVNTRLCAQVIRQSDGKYLNSSGTFVTGRVLAATITDSSITGAGYSGVSFFQQSTITSPTYSDDYTLEGVDDNSSCDPYLVDYTVIPGTTLWVNGYDSFSVAE